MSRTKTKTVTLKDKDEGLKPQRTFGELIGFQGVDEEIYSLYQAGRLPQVMVLEGRPGIGKRMLMARLAARFYCETHTACGSCEGCRSVIKGYQSDLFWLESDGTMKVADAENLQEHLQYQATGNPRIAVIIDIEKLNDQAANRLLKILEEPPAGVQILASCGRFDKLLPTIRSRAVRWRVAPPRIEESHAWLKARLPQAQDAQIDEALQMFGLSPGRALEYIDGGSEDRQRKLAEVQRILLSPMKGESLKELQELIKELGWKANDLAQFFEMALNRSYRRRMASAAATSAQDFRRVKHRRRILQQVHKASAAGQNTLNVLLVAEALMSPHENV